MGHRQASAEGSEVEHRSAHRIAEIPRPSHLYRGVSAIDAGGRRLGRDDHKEGVPGVAGGARQLRRQVCQLSIIVQPTLIRRPAEQAHSASAHWVAACVLGACMVAMPAGGVQVSNEGKFWQVDARSGHLHACSSLIWVGQLITGSVTADITRWPGVDGWRQQRGCSSSRAQLT